MMLAVRYPDPPTALDEHQTSPTIKRITEANSICNYIENRFNTCFGAQITCDYPNLLAVCDNNGNLLAATGYRGSSDKFFHEQYLDAPIESLLAELSGEIVDRNCVVEVGNLTGTNPRAVYFLLDTLRHTLVDAGYQYITLTATRQIRRCLSGMPYWRLADANNYRVKNPHLWGSYYQHAPWVIGGNLEEYDHRYSVDRNKRNKGQSVKCSTRTENSRIALWHLRHVQNRDSYQGVGNA